MTKTIFTAFSIIAIFLLTACSLSPDSSTTPPSPSTIVVRTQPTPTEIKQIESQTTPNAISADKPVIAYNELKEGQLTSPGQIDEWVFNAQAGERVNIVLNSQFDSYLELFAPDGEFIASNDDSGNKLTATLFDVQLKKSGPYTIVVRGYDNATGGYVLALTGGHPTLGGGLINSGEPRSILLTEQGYKWQFQGGAGKFLTVSVATEEKVDSYLSLYAPDGTLLVSDDDSGGNLNAEIFEFELPVDGKYTIRAYAVQGAGLVTVTANVADRASGGGPLTVGAPQTGVLKPGRVHNWEFIGEAGQIVNLKMNSPDFDTFLELRNSQNVILVENDDSPDGGTNSSIDLFTLPTDDTYTVVARGVSEQEGGNYDITLKIAKVTPGGGPLVPDEQVQAQLPPGETNSWTFEADAGMFLTINTQSELLDTYLELYGPDGTLLVEDDDSGGGLNAALLDFPLPQSGAYQLVVRSARDNTDGGVYDIVLMMAEDVTSTGWLATGESQEMSLNQGEQHTWAFNANEGDQVTIEMVSENLDTYLALYDSSGEIIALNDDFQDTNAVIDNYTIPQDGEYRVVARAYSGEEAGSYTISLEIIE